MTLLTINNFTIEFPSRRGTLVAVDHVSLNVKPGEVLGIVGESGAGKSTIGNAIIGLLEPPGRLTSGNVLLKGKRIENLTDEEKRKIRGKRIGMIFQDPMTSLNPLQTIEEQLVETITVHLNVSEKEAQQRAVNLLDEMGIPEPEVRVKQYPHQFSGGMRQRVVIALTFCAEPEVIIADEPTTALDVSIQAQILDLIRKLCRDKKVGIILITHDMGVISEITDRVAVMYRSKLIEEGTTWKILNDPDHPYTQSLISAVPRMDVRLDRFPQIDYIEAAETPKKKLDVTTHWLGEASKNTSKGLPEGTPLVSLKNLNMRFVTKHAFLERNRTYLDAVNNVSLDIFPGETLGLVGESGSGKSTIARIITGLYKPNNGSVTFEGANLTAIQKKSKLDIFRRQMQMIFQDPYSSLNARMKVLDIVAEPIRFHKLCANNQETIKVVKDLLDIVGLGNKAAYRYPHEFSGGQRQRISIARALASRPRFLICDEPTSALDVSIQAQILNLLKDLQEELNLTMLFISHDLPVIRQMCDRIGVMRTGKLLELAKTDDLFNTPQHEYSKHLISLVPKMSAST